MVDLFPSSYENEFLERLSKDGKRKIARKFSLSYCYRDDLISLNNYIPVVKEFISDIYHRELTIPDHKEPTSGAAYLNLLFMRDVNSIFTAMSSSSPSTPAFDVYASIFIHCAHCCSNYGDYISLCRSLLTRFLSQGHRVICLPNTVQKFCGRHII